MLSSGTWNELLRASELLLVSDVDVGKSALCLEIWSCFLSTDNKKADITFEVFLLPWRYFLLKKITQIIIYTKFKSQVSTCN